MPDFTLKNFPLGWCPSDNTYNGRDDALLRMDNCHLDDIGIVSSFRGYASESTGVFGNITSIYSKVLDLLARIGGGYPNDAKVRYVYNQTAGTLVRNYGPGFKAVDVFEVGVLSGATSRECAFITALGHILCFAGSQQYKDRGDVQLPIGFSSSGPPTLTVLAQPSVNADNSAATGNYTRWDTAAIKGSSYNKASDYIEIYTDATSFRGIVQVGKDTATTLDLTNFGTGTGRDTPSDIFKWNVRISDTSKLLKIRLEFLLNVPTTDGVGNYTENATDYFWNEWEVNSQSTVQVPVDDPNIYEYSDDPEFRQKVEQVYKPQTVLTPVMRLGDYAWTPLQQNRGFFNRVGSDSTKGWANVKGVRVSFIATDVINCVFNNMEFLGGKDVLNGTYKYIQVDVRNTGYYKAVGISSAESAEIYVNNSTVTVDPVTVNSQANECWIFRSSRNVGGYYLVKVITGANGFNPASFTDNVDDIKALRENTPLKGLTLELFRTALPTDIIDGVWFADRVIYLTYSKIIPSYKLDPESYDSRFQYEIAAQQAEVCYFIAKVSEGECLIGTSSDIYSLKGDFAEIDLGNGNYTLNISILPLGVKKPPVSRAYYVDDSTLYYLAEDGWRIHVGSTNRSIVDELSLLYRNQERHGIPAIYQTVSNNNLIACTMSKGRFIAAMSHLSIDRAVHVYNGTLKYWTFYRSGVDDPIALFTEEDGTVLMGGLSSGTNYLRSWDDTESALLPINLTTRFYTLSALDRRNDITSLYVIVDTGNVNLTLTVNYTTATNTIGTQAYTINSNTRTWIPLDASLVTLGISFQFVFSGNTSRFKYYGLGMQFAPRPALVKRVFIPSSNLGDPRRKRTPTWPVQIDTFGTTVTFTPIVDGTSLATSSLVASGVRTVYHYFTSDVTGVDYGCLLTSSGLFEYHGFIPPFISEVFPQKAKYLTISPNDLGTNARKRIPAIAYKLNSFSSNVTVTPVSDGSNDTGLTVNTSDFLDTNYYYTSDHLVTDMGYSVSGSSPFEFAAAIPNVIETLPIRAKFIKFDENDFGKPVRKDVNTIPIKINSAAGNVTLTPRIDGTNKTTSTLNTSEPEVVKHYYTDEQSGVNHGFSVSGAAAFELYPVIEPNFTTIYPQQARYLKVPANDLGSQSRKRTPTWPVKFDSFGQNITVTPKIDGVDKTASTLAATGVRTLNHYFEVDTTGVDYGYSISSSNVFEHHGFIPPAVTETFPQKAKFIQLSEEDLGTNSRKRIPTIAFKINSFGSNVSVVPVTDTTDDASLTVNTSEFVDSNYYYTADNTPVTLGAKISGANPFEFKGLLPKITETFPTPMKYLEITQSNLGTNARKRIPTISFRLNSFGANASVIPVSDNIDGSTLTVNSSSLNDTDYYYTEDHLVNDLGVKISSGSPFEFEGSKPFVVETLPSKAKYIKFDESDFGRPVRKDVVTIPIKINSLSNDVTVAPVIDGVLQAFETLNTPNPSVENYYYTEDKSGVNHGLTVFGDDAFELYPLITPHFTEIHPQKAKYTKFTENDFGKPVRKDVNTIPVRINSTGENVTFTPRIDGTNKTPSTLNSTEPSVVYHYYTDLQTGVNHGFAISGNSPFELYPIIEPNFSQVYPQKAKFLSVPQNDLGEPRRKRVNTWPFKVTGSSITVTPRIDGTNKTTSSLTASEPTVLNHYFTDDQTGVNFGYSLGASDAFEAWPTIAPNVTELFPQKAKFFKTSENNFGSPSRKDFNKWSFRVNTWGGSVAVNPTLDDTTLPYQAVSNWEFLTESFFATDYQSATDLGVTFTSIDDVAFELDKIETPNFTKVHPVSAKYVKVDPVNFGVDSKKRIRTWPWRLNTLEGSVQFNPMVDGAMLGGSTYETEETETVHHMFDYDVNGTDYGGVFQSTEPFELAEMKLPTEVEKWPVPKKLDQIGPLEVYKVGILRNIKLRLIPTTPVIDWILYDRDTQITHGSLTVVPNAHAYYEIDFNLDSVSDLQVLRFEFSAEDRFYRTGAWFKVYQSGKESTYDYASTETK